MRKRDNLEFPALFFVFLLGFFLNKFKMMFSANKKKVVDDKVEV